MERTDFRIIYVGSDVTEAEKGLSEADGCAVIYCEQGYGVVYIDGEKGELLPNKLIALHWHGKSQGITLSEDFKGQFFICMGALAEMLLSYYTEKKSFYVSRTDEHLGKAIPPSENQSIEGALYAFHSLLRSMRSEETRSVGKAGSTSVSAIKEYIDTHIEEKITLELLSRQFFVSKTQIHRLFTAAYGISPMKYMLKSKIEYSKKLLLSTTANISEIAEKLSFTDSKHYTKTFRNFTGMLPSAYRRSEGH